MDLEHMEWIDGLEEGREIDGRYVITSSIALGTGATASVYRGAIKNISADGSSRPGQPIAIKVLDRLDVEDDPRKVQQMERELQITMKLKHPHIVNLLDIVFEEQFLYLIFELATDGALFDVVAAGKPLTEDEARFAFNQMCSAVQYCHEQNVVHRDLKLENIVMTNTPDGSFLKITDFGVSKDFGINSMPKTRVGTISYMAPEVTMVAKLGSGVIEYGKTVDVWSLGVILYLLVVGQYPFGFDGPRAMGGLPAHEVYQKIRAGEVKYPPSLSDELRELLAGIFVTDPSARWDLQRISECCWIRGVTHAERATGPPAQSESVYEPPSTLMASLELAPANTDVQWPSEPTPRTRARYRSGTGPTVAGSHGSGFGLMGSPHDPFAIGTPRSDDDVYDAAVESFAGAGNDLWSGGGLSDASAGWNRQEVDMFASGDSTGDSEQNLRVLNRENIFRMD